MKNTKTKTSTNVAMVVLSVIAVILVVLIIAVVLSRRGAQTTAAVPTVMQFPATAQSASTIASTSVSTSAPAAQTTDNPSNTPPAPIGNDKIPPDTKLIVGTVDNDIEISSDGINFRTVGLKGQLPSISPDGRTILYMQEASFTSYQSGQTTTNQFFLSELASNMVMSGDGRLVLASGYDPDKNQILVNRRRLYWSSDPTDAVTMVTVPNSKIPAVLDPKTDRILLGQQTGDHETTLYTIEQACLNSQCDKSRQDIAKVPYSVNWVNYQPDGSNIVFSEDDGNIYLLSVSTKQVTPLLIDSTKKSRPVFNADATELLYLDSNRAVNILRLSDKKVISTGGVKIVSASWVKQPTSTIPAPAAPPNSQIVKAILSTSLISDMAASSNQQLVIATTDNDILVSDDGVTFNPTGLKGSVIAPSPDGKTLAYALIGRPIQLDQNNKDMPTQLSYGGVVSWSGDGKKLLQMSGGGGWRPTTGTYLLGGLWHVEVGDESNQESPVAYGQNIPFLGGPAISDPQSSRLILTQVTDLRQTRFVSIDANCDTANKCFDDMQDLATVPYTVNWISGSQDGNTIVFSEDDGNIYLLALDSGKVTPLVVNANYKTRPAFSPDGKQIAFIDQAQQLNILQLSDKSIKVVAGLAISSVAWKPAPNATAEQASAATPSTVIDAGDANTQGVGYVLPDDVQLIVSTTDHDILVSSDLKMFERTGLKGDYVSVAPDRKTLAYFRNDRVWIYQNGAEASFNSIGPSQSNPSWSQDLPMMVFDIITDKGIEIVRSGIGTHLIDGVNSMAQIPNVFAPTVFDPSTGGLLLAISQPGQKTAFATVDPLCLDTECQQFANLGIVPYDVTSTSFLPDGTAIAFSEKGGNIYLFSPGTGKVSPLIVDKTHKSHVAVSGDGSKIAYLDDAQQLYIVNLSDKSVRTYAGLKIQNARWLR